MIFTPVNKIDSKDEYLEKILVYIRIVEVIAERNKDVVPKATVSDAVIDEIVDMGILCSREDIILLEKFLKNEYVRFVNCISYYLTHKKLFGNLLDKLSNKKRKLIQEEYKKENRPTYADFFAGAGGLSYGFTQAGFRVCFANDFEDVCVRTYRYNHPELPSDKVIKGDIRKIVDNVKDFIDENVDIVVGGPPCQGFSSANQQRVIDDPRNELYKYYIKGIRKILPKFVVMENVKGMLKVADQVVEDYENIKEEKNGEIYTYSVGYKLLNAVDFSVAQSRERLIYIAVRNDIAEKKGITPDTIFKEVEAQPTNPVGRVYGR